MLHKNNNEIIDKFIRLFTSNDNIKIAFTKKQNTQTIF